MIVNKYLLPNGNVILWRPSKREDNIENILILAGGGILLLKSIKHIDMLYSYIREDVLSLSLDELVKKYKLEGYEDIYSDLRKELNKGGYPTYDKNYIYNYLSQAIPYIRRLDENEFDSIKIYILKVLSECEDSIKRDKERKK